MYLAHVFFEEAISRDVYTGMHAFAHTIHEFTHNIHAKYRMSAHQLMMHFLTQEHSRK